MTTRVLTCRELRSEKGIALSPSQLWRLRKEGKFPAPIRLSEHRIVWREKDIDAWLDGRPTVGSTQDRKAAAADIERASKMTAGRRKAARKARKAKAGA